MELIATNVTEHGNCRRLTGVIRYDDASTEEYWFDVPNAYQPSRSGNPWLACLLPLAATIGEDLTIPLPVDRELLLGSESLLRLWKYWRVEMHVVKISVESITSLPPKSDQAASFFSAGVDSFFTVLRRPDVKNWITVQGFDMPISKKDEFEIHCQRLSRIASDFGKEFISAATNIRQTRWRKAHWEAIAFGPALAAMALVFEDYFYEVLIPSSCDYSSLDPWGSHPLSDPLFSTCQTKLIHEGVAYSRTEKIEYLVENNRALSELHVCFRGDDSLGQDHKNCCRCEKCYRTMIALEILGKLGQCSLFDASKFQIGKISKIYISHRLDEKFFLDLRATAIARGRTDLAKEIDRSLKRSKYIDKLDYLSKIPFVWRFGQSLTEYLLRDSPK